MPLLSTAAAADQHQTTWPARTARPRMLYLISASQTRDMVNMNAFQRLYFLSRTFPLTVLAPRGSCFRDCVDPSTAILQGPCSGSLGVAIAFLSRAFRTRGDFDADIVITEPSVLCLCGFLFHLLSGRPWVVDVWDIPIRCTHGSALRRWRARLLRRLCRWTFRKANLFIVSIIPDLELKWFGIAPSRQLALSNAIWTDGNLSPLADEQSTLPPRTILCMRTKHAPDMGLDTLAEAFLAIKSRGADVKLSIVGRISARAESQVRAIRSHPDVKFHEFVTHAQLLVMIRSAWVCVVPFRNVADLAQTYPIKMLEYLSMGKVIVASRILGLSRMIHHGDNGLLFNPGDSADLAEKIESLLRDPGLHQRLVSGARLPAGATAPEKATRIIDAIRSLYATSISGPRP